MKRNKYLVYNDTAMEDIVRFGVSFDEALHRKFTRLLKRQGYSNRSAAIRDLVRKAIIEDSLREEAGQVVGTITMVFDHDISQINDRLRDIQHDRHSVIYSTTHIHLDHDTCMEIIAVKGNGDEVRELADNLRAVRGVRFAELMMTRAKV